MGLAVAGCATETSPLLREDLARLRTDVARLEQSIQKSQAEVRADLQQADRRSAQTLAELQRSVARLGSRFDDLGQDTAQIQGRLDEIRRQVDALALQVDVGTAPSPGTPPADAPRQRGGPPSGEAPGAPGTAALEPTPPGQAAPAPAAALVRQATDLYQTAYMDYTRGNYNLAIAGFEEFIRRYPETDLAEKAQYWIAESHYSLARELQGRNERDKAIRAFERARQEFRNVLIKYPRGDRVPAALYKEALALLELGQPELATTVLQYLLDQFPSTEEAAKAKEQLAQLLPR